MLKTSQWWFVAVTLVFLYYYFASASTRPFLGVKKGKNGAYPKSEEWQPRKFSQRVVAVGDLHGDLERASKVLRMLGVVDHRNRWIGKSTILVQTGDIVDRGKDTIALYHLFDHLRAQADKAGGAVISLLGNHEYMNAFGDWRYVTKEDIDTFHGEQNRRLAMSGQGWIGRTWLGNYSVTARVPYYLQFPHLPKQSIESAIAMNRIIQTPLGADPASLESEDQFAGAAASFVHGGIHPSWSSKSNPIDTINEVGYSLLAKAIGGPLINPMGLPRNTTLDERALYDENGPLWYRGYALEEDDNKICEQVEEVRADLAVRRLIMGHTPHFEAIKSRCNGRVLLIDTGISRAYGGVLSALSITYTLTPVIPLTEDQKPPIFHPKKENLLRWVERENVVAMYENGKKENIVLAARSLVLDTRPPDL